jgi:DNA-binding NtrC family response regulator
MRVDGDAIFVSNIGRRELLVDGRVVDRAVVRPGDMLEIKNRLLLLCVIRPVLLPRCRSWDREKTPSFGAPDSFGLVGESLAAWALRDQIAFLAPRNAHVLVRGESGTGKELAAQALHALSSRASRRIVARNAATIPSGLVDAELFGSVASYPNANSPDRPGLVGEADGSTLFLDEIGELPEELQTHLLRVADAEGDYQRLGESRRRRASFRLIGATNRPLDRLKPDLLARIPLRLAVPGLNERIEDVPLVARYLLGRIAARDPEMGQRFFDGWNGRTGEPRVTAALVRAVTQHRYTTHVRELESLLWCAIATSAGDHIDLTDELRSELEGRRASMTPSAPPPSRSLSLPAPPSRRDAREVSEDELRASMTRHAGVQSKVWRELGLANRYVLQRLLRRYGIKSA